MKLMKKDIHQNQLITTFFALESLQIRRNKRQDNYLVLGLHDRTGRINGYLWSDPLETAALLREKTFVKVKGLSNLSNGSLIINIERIRTADKTEIDILDFLDVAPGGIPHWHNRLLRVVETIQDSNCRQIIKAFLDDQSFMELFTTSPGGVSVHHNYIGGLLEHTVCSMELALHIAERHHALINRDLLLTGTLLHDIGKTKEIYWEVAREYTTIGKLLGHIAVGIIMFEEKIRGIANIPEELANLLRHMILAHHGTQAHGSPVKPATPEALLLHLVEATDAKINHLYCHLGNSEPEAQWSAYDRVLETELYRKRYSGNMPTPAVAA